jgi:hypothetical protein
VWIELDYMVDTDHTHEPLPGVTLAIEDSFSEEGIELLLDLDEPLAHADALSFFGGPPDSAACSDWVSLPEVKAAHFDVRRRPVYRYGVLGHRLRSCEGTSGFTWNSTLAVTLGAFDEDVGSLEQQTGTLLHEIGHTFGLNHSGYGSTPAKETNYQSVMSYLYQLSGLHHFPEGTATADWSHEELSLDEAALDEGVGIDSRNEPDDLYYALWACPLQLEPRFASPIGEVDWDCDGAIDLAPVSAHLDDDVDSDDVVVGRDDWATLAFAFQCSPIYHGGFGAPLVDIDDEELSYEEASRSGLLDRPLRAGVDPLPACSADPLPADGTGKLQVAILGSAGLDVTEIAIPTVRISSAVPIAHQVVDADGDLLDDLIVEVEVDDLMVGDPPAAVLSGERTDGTQLLGGRYLQWVPTAVDTDGDGVQDACDLCPSSAGGAASPDGCP